MWLRTSSQCSAASSLDCKRRVATKPVPTPLPRPRMVGFQNHRPLGQCQAQEKTPYRLGSGMVATGRRMLRILPALWLSMLWSCLVKRVKLKAGNVTEFRIITLLFGTVPPCDFYRGQQPEIASNRPKRVNGAQGKVKGSATRQAVPRFTL